MTLGGLLLLGHAAGTNIACAGGRNVAQKVVDDLGPYVTAAARRAIESDRVKGGLRDTKTAVLSDCGSSQPQKLDKVTRLGPFICCKTPLFIISPRWLSITTK